MKIFHQAGHNTNWNIGSFTEEGCGHGLIFSPVHYAKDRINSTDRKLKSTSLFDPQFYVPASQKDKLQSYEFFPDRLANGFATVDFEAIAHKSAEMCIDFQIENEFESIIVPARHFQDLVTDYIEKQRAFTVDPFLAELRRRKIQKKVFLSLPVTTAMTKDRAYRSQLLNWITSYPEISGVYFLNQMFEASKQITDFDKFLNHIEFIHDLKNARLDVIVGYCNTEAIILSALDPYGLTIGAYENTRSFSVDKFLEEESEKRGPAPRLYFPKLLNWIRYDTAVEIRDDHPEIWKSIYSPTPHSETILESGVRPHFTQPGIYKHHFLLLNAQLSNLSKLPVNERIASIKGLLAQAKDLYAQIDKSGVMYFDQNCSGDHLPIWNRAVSKIG